MPEGHVIHRLARKLTTMAGDVTVSSPQGRFAHEAAVLSGFPLTSAEAYGKHLFIHFDPHIVYIHLGLIGQMRFEPIEDVWGHIRFRIEHGAVAANLRGPQRCELIDASRYASIISSAGQDPLREDARPEVLAKKVLASRRSIGSMLMDQKLYAGVGNIYRAETLFRLGINPYLPGKELDRSQVDAIWNDLVFLMRIGEQRGRIDTVRDEHLPERMNRPPRVDDHGGEVYVYRREGEPCYICGTPIKHADMQGRNLFYCPRCQQVP